MLSLEQDLPVRLVFHEDKLQEGLTPKYMYIYGTKSHVPRGPYTQELHDNYQVSIFDNMYYMEINLVYDESLSDVMMKEEQNADKISLKSQKVKENFENNNFQNKTFQSTDDYTRSARVFSPIRSIQYVSTGYLSSPQGSKIFRPTRRPTRESNLEDI